MGHMSYLVPVEEVHLAIRQGIVRSIHYNRVQYNPSSMYIDEDHPETVFLDYRTQLPFGTKISVTFLDLYEEYWEIKNRYELVESYKKKYGVREINIWVEDYISLDGFNEDGSPKFSTGGTIKDE